MLLTQLAVSKMIPFSHNRHKSMKIISMAFVQLLQLMPLLRLDSNRSDAIICYCVSVCAITFLLTIPVWFNFGPRGKKSAKNIWNGSEAFNYSCVYLYKKCEREFLFVLILAWDFVSRLKRPVGKQKDWELQVIQYKRINGIDRQRAPSGGSCIFCEKQLFAPLWRCSYSWWRLL